MIKENCLLCDKEFWLNDVWIWKIDLETPVFFCLDCGDKWEDKNKWVWVVCEWKKYYWLENIN